MAKKDRAYKIGDLVFAKVKGYPPWPAKIVKLSGNKKYNVYFYGTGETGYIKVEDLFAYVESKAKLATEKHMKKPQFKEAIEQIEAALKGQDSAPIDMPLAETESADDTAPTDSSQLDIKSDPDVEDSPQVEKAKGKQSAKKAAQKNETPKAKAEKAEPKAEVKNDVVAPDETPASPVKDNGAEVTSRSGRKIKPKKYLLEEVEELPVTPKRKTGSLDNTNADLKPPKIAKLDNDVAQDDKIKLHLKNQGKLIDLTTRIKATLGLQSANPEACVKLLEEYNDLEITPIMLLKNPACVETVKRLRKYVGNVKQWVMSDQEKEEFELNAVEVRKRSQSIYTQFKKMFINSDGTPFWEFFTKELELFNSTTKSLTMEELVQMTDLPEAQKHLSAIAIVNDKSTKENQTPNDHLPDIAVKMEAEQDDTVTNSTAEA
ncbi:hepatoma-derived growth factor-related protein 2-like [Phlebotomus argentipes]|uniref:hepatoma-derived growth factor-related protein 2-like n=1 Tax=Phlebotomus argentipes TaxID=94469 RepID=UPI002892C248|nr:hepatoma-derived growth factor-related protein 2-like [Phlebotomus argentipes]